MGRLRERVTVLWSCSAPYTVPNATWPCPRSPDDNAYAHPLDMVPVVSMVRRPLTVDHVQLTVGHNGVALSPSPATAGNHANTQHRAPCLLSVCTQRPQPACPARKTPLPTAPDRQAHACPFVGHAADVLMARNSSTPPLFPYSAGAVLRGPSVSYPAGPYPQDKRKVIRIDLPYKDDTVEWNRENNNYHT